MYLGQIKIIWEAKNNLEWDLYLIHHDINTEATDRVVSNSTPGDRVIVQPCVLMTICFRWVPTQNLKSRDFPKSLVNKEDVCLIS